MFTSTQTMNWKNTTFTLYTQPSMKSAEAKQRFERFFKFIFVFILVWYANEKTKRICNEGNKDI